MFRTNTTHFWRLSSSSSFSCVFIITYNITVPVQCPCSACHIHKLMVSYTCSLMNWQVGQGYPHDAPKVKCETQVRTCYSGKSKRKHQSPLRVMLAVMCCITILCKDEQLNTSQKPHITACHAVSCTSNTRPTSTTARKVILSERVAILE
jgi:hypothetical protein